MIKTTLRELVECQVALRRVLSEKVPVKTAFKLGEVAKACNEKLQLFEKSRKDLVNEFGEEVEAKEGQQVPPGQKFIPPENKDEFEEQLNELFDTETELQINKLKQNLLSKIDITGAEAAVLSFLFEE